MAHAPRRVHELPNFAAGLHNVQALLLAKAARLPRSRWRRGSTVRCLSVLCETQAWCVGASQTQHGLVSGGSRSAAGRAPAATFRSTHIADFDTARAALLLGACAILTNAGSRGSQPSQAAARCRRFSFHAGCRAQLIAMAALALVAAISCTIVRPYFCMPAQANLVVQRCHSPYD